MNNSFTNWKKQISLFLSAQTISLFGSSLVQYAIIWYITLKTSSGLMMTISTVCGFLPQIAISLFAGVWIDRYNRKILIMLADTMIAVSTLIVALLFLRGYDNIWLLYFVLLVRSAGTGIQTPAVNAFIPQLVPAEKLMRVNGIFGTIAATTMFLSPAVAGAVLAYLSLEIIFFIDVVTAVIGVSITAFIKAETTCVKTEEKSSHLKEIKQGLDYLKTHGFIKNLLLFQITILFLISPAAFLTPLMISRTFGAEVWRLTVSEMTFSGGAILGGLLITVWGGFKNRMHTTLFAAAMYGVLEISLGLAPIFTAYLIINALVGISLPFYNTPITVMIQEKVDPQMHGRVFSFMQIAVSSALPLGMILFGPLADITSVQSLLIFCGIIVMLITIRSWRNNRLSME